MNQLPQVIDTVLEAEKLWAILATVPDPEIPVLSVIDLGIVRDIQVTAQPMQDFVVEVVITPTYSGCPAMDAICFDTRLKLLENGYRNIIITTRLSPAWTTDWMTESGKEKLKAYGIAPPQATPIVCDIDFFSEAAAIECPACGSYHTTLVSRFGSTPCKSLYRCLQCSEPFDYFKCH
jgi:ring-1,2-phenylacetyl-CoA epoxidase subunit PaaD